MDNEVLIEVSHLSRFYPGKHGIEERHNHVVAVDNISFTLQRGEILGFLGPNGAGKSTTMKMLTGNLAPSEGRIKIGGFDLMDDPVAAKALVGYLPDTPPLYKELTVDEYLFYCARLNRVARKGLKRAVQHSKERCGLTEHGKRVINNLSKGYQQRVGIAQAIIHAPDIVILDEPTVGLDPIQMIEIRKLIRELGENHSVMLSSHILPEIQTVCDNVQIINQGRLVFNAPIEQLNQQMNTQVLRMRCSRTVDRKQLEKLDGIQAIEQDGESWLIEGRTESTDSIPDTVGIPDSPPNNTVQLSQQLVELSCQNHWGLYELSPVRRSLEDIFMSLTCTEPELTELSNNKSNDHKGTEQKARQGTDHD